jgi:ATP-dependent DNA helicase RecG
MKSLQDSVQYSKGVGPKRLELLKRLGIETLRDLLYFVPRGYEDRSLITPISRLRVGERATIKARVVAAEKFRVRGGREMAHVEVEDDSGRLTCTWFHTRFFREQDFPAGREMLFTGKADSYNGLPRMISPEHELSDEGEMFFGPHILPIYPLTEDLNQNALRRVMKEAVGENAGLVEDMFDAAFLKEHNLPALADAIRNIHFPETPQAAAQARRRLAYDELFLLELGMAQRRRDIRREDAGLSFQVTPEIDQRIRRRFPFKLTGAQERAIAEIAADMRSPKAMNRMLQGDVGSGKTVVALYAMLVAVANRCQAALMAPTEILATQHFETIQRYLAGSRVRTALLVGGRSARERKQDLERVAAGEADLVVGTHALVEGDVAFKKLGLVVVDEQHKFGVIQRAKLRQKGRHPDVLVMTATPIPRTLALTVFGDLDLSTLDEMPPGRQPVRSKWYPPEKLEAAYEFIRARINAGEQAFVVYPLVEESEALDLKAATTSAEHLQRKVFPEFRIALLHGRMRPDEKDRVMSEFRAGRYHILVSTIVVEVGIDIPNATIMVIEHAERFGLAQLHQLRGRIGRGSRPSFLLLFAEPKGEEPRKRLNIICSTTDGFRIAEEDLKLRGPGEFFGTRQHGLPELRVADIINDYALLQLARRDAFRIVADDPGLAKPEHAKIRARLEEAFKNRLDLIRIG